MKKWNFAGGLCLCMVLVLAQMGRAEQVDNPNYKMWSNFKPGSWARYNVVTDGGAFKSELVMTMKLVEVTPEKVVLETSSTINAGGQKIDTPAQKTEIPAKVEKKEGGNANADVTSKEVGEEDVAVSGKSYKCKVQETTGKSAGGSFNGKTWSSEQVPGGTVKVMSKTEGATTSNTTMTLAECEVNPNGVARPEGPAKRRAFFIKPQLRHR